MKKDPKRISLDLFSFFNYIKQVYNQPKKFLLILFFCDNSKKMGFQRGLNANLFKKKRIYRHCHKVSGGKHSGIVGESYFNEATLSKTKKIA